jgi:hypothetical protein
MNTATLPRPILPSVRRSVVEERLRFVARLLDGGARIELCLEFGISRKTGSKIFDRYDGLPQRVWQPHTGRYFPPPVHARVDLSI